MNYRRGEFRDGGGNSAPSNSFVKVVKVLLIALFISVPATRILGQWKNLYSFPPRDMWCIAFLPSDTIPSTGFIGLDDNNKAITMKTTDGGISWHEVYFEPRTPINKVGATAFAFKDSLTAWAVSGTPYVWKTTDGGEHWYVVDTSSYPEDILFLSNSETVLCTQWSSLPNGLDVNGKLLFIGQPKTTDGAVGLSFSDDLRGISTPVTSTHGYVWYTVDGGHQWSQSSLNVDGWHPIAYQGTDTFFLLSSYVWTPGGGNIVWRSMDGGKDWDSIYHYHVPGNQFDELTEVLGVGFGGSLIVQTTKPGSEGIMISYDSGYHFESLCGPIGWIGSRFFVKDSFIYAADTNGVLWLNTTGIGSNSTPQVSTTVLDWPSRYGCIAHDSVITLTYFDSCSGRQARLVSANITGSLAFSFAGSSDTPRTIHPEDSLVIHYAPSGPSPDTARLHLRLHLGFVDRDTTILLTGAGHVPKENLTLRTAFTTPSVAAGQTTNLVITPDKAISSRGLSKIEFDLLYNGDLLEKTAESTSVSGASITASPLTPLRGRERGVHVVVNGNDMSLDPTLAIARLTFKAYVTDTTTTKVAISNLQLNDGDKDFANCVLSADTSATTFTLALQCGDSILSRYLRTNGLFIDAIRPNPASGAVRLSVRSAADGVAEIEVVNALGEVVASHERGLASGMNEIELPTSTLPNGVYYVRLRSHGNTVGASVVIER